MNYIDILYNTSHVTVWQILRLKFHKCKISLDEAHMHICELWKLCKWGSVMPSNQLLYNTLQNEFHMMVADKHKDSAKRIYEEYIKPNVSGNGWNK